MYMANARILRLGPSIGGNASFSIFRYQYVGILEAKFCVNVSASQWNVGFRVALGFYVRFALGLFTMFHLKFGECTYHNANPMQK